MLEPDTLDRIPKDTNWSIERSYFPSLVERGETFVAYVYRGYWIDIGTPEKYVQVHRDIMDRPLPGAARSPGDGSNVVVAESAQGGRRGRTRRARASSDEGAVVKAGARIGPYSVIGRQVHVEEGARGRGHARLAQLLDRPRGVAVAARARPQLPRRPQRLVARGRVLGDKSVVTDYSRV